MTRISGAMAVVMLLASVAGAGPLVPPPGPPTSTDQALRSTDPRTPIGPDTTPGDNDSTPSLFKITQPGSYFLTGDVVGAAGVIGIEIVANDVTLDLGGFTVRGGAGSLDGVRTTLSGLRRIVVANGGVVGWGGSGVDLGNAIGTIVRDLFAENNAIIGISSSSRALIERCITVDNGSQGISVGGESVVRFCVSSFNGSEGIRVSSGSVVENCSAVGNQFVGIQTGTGSVVRGVSALSNGNNGILANLNNTVVDCNGSFNQGAGITAAQGSIVRSNSARGNSLDGIRVSDDCLVMDNIADTNGLSGVAAGILVTGTDCVVRDNTITDNDVGIQTTASGNFVVRNTASGNATNWSVASGTFGLFVQASSSGGFNGAAGGATLGSTDPYANFSF